MINQPVPKLKVGGTLGLDDLYVRRVEDDIVFDALAEGEFCNILTSRQMGKSSLMVRLMNRLQKERGARIASVDLAGDLGAPTKSENDEPVPDPDRWYKGFLRKVADDLGIDCDVDVWWRDEGRGTPNGHLLQFFRTLVAPGSEQPVFVFVDEVDASLKLPYSDDFFTAVRAIYNQRSTVTEYRGITFCLVGVASPGELIKERHTTPYNVGRTIELRDFDPKLHDLSLLYAAMSVDGAPGADLVHAVLHRSSGHPFLTVALCERALAENVRTVAAIEKLLDTPVLSTDNDALANHFKEINKFLSNRLHHERETLRLYDTILRGKYVRDRVTLVHLDLKLSGLVKRSDEGFLLIRNRFYQKRFGRAWLGKTEPMKKLTRRRRLSLASVSLFAGLVSSLLALTHQYKLDCKTASLESSDDAALVVCEREYEQTRDLHTAVYTADLRWRAGNLDGAAALANGLLATDVHGEALRILGGVAFAERRMEDAFNLLQQASEIHRRTGRHAELARDILVSTNLQIARSQYADALASYDDCLIEARAADDDALQGECHLSVVRALTFAGYFEAADQELDRAEKRIHKDRDLALLWYERGTLHQIVARDLRRRSLHQTQDQSAIAAFENSLRFAKRAESVDMMCDTYLSIAYSLADAGKTADAEAHLALSASGACGNRLEAKRREVTARIAYRRGDLSRAFSENEHAYPAIGNEEDKFDVCTMQALIALDRSDMVTAMFWAKRGIEVAERIAAGQGRSELRSWILASRREPFEILFVALVRLERVDDAIAIFDQWQGSTLLGEMPGSSASVTAMTSDVAARAPIDVVALVVALGDAWRVTASQGRFQIARLGGFAGLADRLDRFRTASTDRALGKDLGALILPADIIRKTVTPLYVVLDIPFSELPFAALRYDEQPVVTERPIVRIPRLLVSSFSSCDMHAERGHAARHALILADANDDLPEARREGKEAASLLGVTPLFGKAATSAALFSAKPGALLHIAVHAQDDAESRVLRLGDRTVSAQEIAGHEFGASLVILSGTSTGVDSSLGISLATAFLASRSQFVLATLRPIADAGARALVDAFYSENGVDEPVLALARVQSRASASDNKEWASLAVFSSCVPRE